jgi:hypothetical protein
MFYNTAHWFLYPLMSLFQVNRKMFSLQMAWPDIVTSNFHLNMFCTLFISYMLWFGVGITQNYICNFSLTLNTKFFKVHSVPFETVCVQKYTRLFYVFVLYNLKKHKIYVYSLIFKCLFPVHSTTFNKN